jgi:hypothetical protein
MAAIKTTQVIERYENIDFTQGAGGSFGQLVDEAIGRALSDGGRYQEFSVLFDEEEWTRLQRMHGSNPDPIAGTRKKIV